MHRALALLLILCGVPARAEAEDEDKATTLSAEIDLLKLENDADKELFREALIMAGRRDGMRRAAPNRPNTEEARKRFEQESVELQEFLAKKKDAIVRRSVELKKKTAEMSAATRQASRPRQPAKPVEDQDRPGLIRKMEEAKVEVELLQSQSQLYQQSLNEAVNALAAAEFVADKDETQRDTADAARKQFDKAREKHLDFRTRLQLAEEKAGTLQQRLGIGFGGMGGMGGMGGECDKGRSGRRRLPGGSTVVVRVEPR